MFQNQLKRDGCTGLVRGNASGTRVSAVREANGKYAGSGIPEKPSVNVSYTV